MKLIVGLGNPGAEYVGTRHNVGFEVLDRVAVKLAVATLGDFDRLGRSKFDGLMLEGKVATTGGDERVLLLKPMTYMNLSGQSVGAAARFYKIEPCDVLVILDELALPAGKIRLRPSGSDGGHNGLRDVQRALGTSQYPRLRVGIEAPPPPVAAKDYVLGRFTAEQRERVEPAIARAADCCVTWAGEGVTAAMNRFNPATAPAEN